MDDPLEVPVQKLGHPVLEIRSWAFFSLLSKLECGLISLQDLTNNEDVIGKLVQWMKHNMCTQREKILELLLSLVKEDSKNIKKLLSVDPELLCLKRLLKVDPLNHLVVQIITEISESGIKQDICVDSLLEIKWNEENCTEFDSLFVLYRLPIDPNLSDQSIELLTQWELKFESDQQTAAADFTLSLIEEFHCGNIVQYSDLIKIVMKQLADVNSINKVKYVLECIDACVSDIQETNRAQQLNVATEAPSSSYSHTSIPFLLLSLLDSLLPHIKLSCKLCLRIVRTLSSCIKSVEAVWSSCSLIGSRFCSMVIGLLSALCEKSNESRDPFTRLQVFLLSHSVLSLLLPPSDLSSLLPSHTQDWILSQLFRPELHYLYPTLVQTWYQLCVNQLSQHPQLVSYKNLLRIKSSLTSTVDCLLYPDSQSIQCVFDSLAGLYYHRDVGIVRVFLDVCSRHILSDPTDLVAARHILLSFLSCSDAAIQRETYTRLAQSVQNILTKATSHGTNAVERKTKRKYPSDCASDEDKHCAARGVRFANNGDGESSSHSPRDSSTSDQKNNSETDDDNSSSENPHRRATSKGKYSCGKRSLDGASVVERLAFLLDTDILIELLCQGTRSSIEEIRLSSLSILQSLLSCRVSVTMETWTQILSILSPILVLLQCTVPTSTASEEESASTRSKQTGPHPNQIGPNSKEKRPNSDETGPRLDIENKLGAEILQLTHPDLAKDIRMSKLQILKCNACLLFHRDSSVRLEATSRLAWYTRYNGPVTSILADLCTTGCTRSSALLDVYEESSVMRVLELLLLHSSSTTSNVPDEESRVRFSCLTQLSVMTDDVKLHRVFLKNGGVTVVVQELHRLLSSKLPDREDRRKQSIGCCVRVLHNVCRENSSVRQQLSEDFSLLTDVIKVLFLINSSTSDSVQLLFTLLYSDFILNSGEEDGSVVSIPVLIRECLHVPETFAGSHWTNSPHTLPDESEEFLCQAHCKDHLSLHWNLHYHYEGDIYTMLESDDKHSPQHDPGGSPLTLQMTAHSWKVLHRTSIVHSCHASLQTLHATQSYTEAYAAVTSLQRYLDCQHIENINQFQRLPFSTILSRYLEPAPSSLQDQQLLLLILNLIQTLPDSQMDWVSQLLVSKTELLSLISPNRPKHASPSLTHHSLLFVHLLRLVRKCIVTRPSCVHAFDTLTQSVFRCIESHEKMDDAMLTSCLDYLSLVLYRLDNPSLDTECLWTVLHVVLSGDGRERCTRLVLRLLQCLELALSCKTSDSVALGVFVSEIHYPSLVSCLSHPRGSVKALTYHFLSGLCSTTVLHNMPRLVDGAFKEVVSEGTEELVRKSAAQLCANVASLSTSEILLRKCLCENFFSKVARIVSTPARPPCIKTPVLHLVNNLVCMNPRLVAQEDTMIHLVTVLIEELVEHDKSPLNQDTTAYCYVLCNILTLYYSSNQESPIVVNDKFNSVLVYILNAGSYVPDIEPASRDSLCRSCIVLLSCLPLPPPLPPSMASTLVHLLQTDNVKTARSILNTLPKLVPHLSQDTLSSLSHTVFSLWSRKFKPNPVLLNAVLALTSRRGPNHGPHHGPHHGPLLVIEYDLLEDVHTRLKQCYVSLECSHGDTEISSELNTYLQLLNNILTQDTRVCEIAAKSGLADTLHKLLGWVHNHETTLDTMLHVMASFTSNCIQACNSFVHTSSLIGSGLSKSVSSSSLVHGLISLIQTHNPGVRVQCLLILSQLMVSNECRYIVSKSTLWDNFLSQPATSSISPPVESAWTRFLRSYSLNLSPHNTTITSNLIDILIEKSYTNLHYFIVLTNLTFHATYQTKLKGNSSLTKLLTDIFSGSESVSVIRYAKAIRSRLNEIESQTEMDGKSDSNDLRAEIRRMNEKLFGKYGELVVFENTLHVGQRKKFARNKTHAHENTLNVGRRKKTVQNGRNEMHGLDTSGDRQSNDDGSLTEDLHRAAEGDKYWEESRNRSNNSTKRSSQGTTTRGSSARNSADFGPKRNSHGSSNGSAHTSDISSSSDDVMNETHRSEHDRSDEKENIPYGSKHGYLEENIQSNRENKSNKHCTTDKRADDDTDKPKRKQNQQDTNTRETYESYRKHIQAENTPRNIHNKMPNNLGKFQNHPEILDIFQTNQHSLNNPKKDNKHLSNNKLQTSTDVPNIIQSTRSYRNSRKSTADESTMKTSNLGVLKSTDLNAFFDLSKACDSVLVTELVKIVKRNAVLVVWNMSANCYKTKVQYRQTGLVNWLQNEVQCDSDFEEEYACVIDMLLA
uniref:Rotatin n=1 Tax=Cacopsylla melanoneura TaxID=428564 RepID=A0A8D8Z4E1_9HEMI